MDPFLKNKYWHKVWQSFHWCNEGQAKERWIYFPLNKIESFGEICSNFNFFHSPCLPLCQSSEDFASILVAYEEFPVCSFLRNLMSVSI